MGRQRRFNKVTGNTSERKRESIHGKRTSLRSPEVSAELTIDVQVILEDPEEMAVREGIHKRIQAEMHHEDKETEARAEEMLEIPPEWNKVPDSTMEEGEILPEDTRPDNWKRDEISQGRRKRRKEDNIWVEKFSSSISEDTKSGGFLCPRLGQRQTRRG